MRLRLPKLLLLLAVTTAAAQTSLADPGPPAGGAGERSGSVTSTGQTKPPGSAATGERSDLDRKSRKLDRKINKGICQGC